MRRREKMLGGLVIATFVLVAASCALNSGAIVYVIADSGTVTDSGNVTLPDGAVVTPDGSIETPDGATVGKCASDQVDLDAGFCIDKTEVTNAKYLAFLSAVGADGGNAPECAGASLLPNGDGVEIFSSPAFPIRGVNWCSARSYCKWAGKRLCGTIADGGELPQGDPNDYKDASSSEWFFACSQNGAQTYPYGNTYDGGACNDSDFREGGVVNVGSLPGCVGGYPGISDMVGNVWEWENSCSDDTSTTASCLVQGNSFMGGMGQSRCDNDFSTNRNSASQDFGIRCCADEK